MSPVSRTRRRTKPANRTGGRSTLSALQKQLGVQGRGRWFDQAAAAVLDQAPTVLAAQHPRALARLTSQLLGAQIHHALVGERQGLWFDSWFRELVTAAETRVREQADGGAWEAPLRLLHGLAAIGPPELARTALTAANRMRKVVGRVPGQDAGPRWPLDVRRLRADGDLVRLRDAWGTRYAVIAGFSYDGRDRSVFLFDVNADFYNNLVSAGDFDDAEQAAAVWQRTVGDTARDARIEPVDRIDQLDCLIHLDMDEAAQPSDLDRSVSDNWFGAQRRLAELRIVLRRWQPGPIVAGSLFRVDTDPAVAEFSRWYRGRHGSNPDHEATAALADEWMSGVIPETRLSASPGRVHHQCSLIGDWIDDEIKHAAIAMLPDWVVWLADRAGYAQPLRTRLADATATELARVI
jgi:hypothetical protein